MKSAWLKVTALVETLSATRERWDITSMPIKSATLRRALSRLQTDAPFVCASCRHRQALSAFNGTVNNHLHHFSRRRPPYARRASTIASVTAVNAQRDIPPEQQALYKSLSALEHEAALSVNLSQLKLTLRSLESEDAVTRVAGLTYTLPLSWCNSLLTLLASTWFGRSSWPTQACESLASGSIGLGAGLGEASCGR